MAQPISGIGLFFRLCRVEYMRGPTLFDVFPLRAIGRFVRLYFNVHYRSLVLLDARLGIELVVVGSAYSRYIFAGNVAAGP